MYTNNTSHRSVSDCCSYFYKAGTCPAYQAPCYWWEQDKNTNTFLWSIGFLNIFLRFASLSNRYVMGNPNPTPDKECPYLYRKLVIIRLFHDNMLCNLLQRFCFRSSFNAWWSKTFLALPFYLFIFFLYKIEFLL